MTIKMNRLFALVLCAAFIGAFILLTPWITGVSVSNAAVVTVCPPQPAEPRPRALPQRFERGYMFWLQDVRVLRAIGDQFSGSAVETYPDTWSDGMPDSDPGLAVPQGRLQPKRGAGYLWRTNQRVRDGLGWALEPETGYTTLIETRGDKTWFAGQGYDVFTIVGQQWQSVDVAKK
jgi:hypothetical protein